MSELFDTIEMKALDQAERERIACEERRAERRREARAKRNKATWTMMTRTGVAAVIATGLWVAGRYCMIDANLVMALVAAIIAWICFWLGAWIQFMWCKGGLMEW